MAARKKAALPPTVTDPGTLSVEELATALKNTYILEMWIKAVRDQAFQMLKNGESIPGFQLGYGVRRRVWREGFEENVATKLEALGVDRKEMFTEPELLSPAKMEALLKDKDMWPAKPRHGDRPPTPIDEFVELSMPEPKVMPIDERNDEGPAKLREAATEFK